VIGSGRCESSAVGACCGSVRRLSAVGE
jgi:hypothetical protein